MFWFLASKYKTLGDFNPLVIIPHRQIFSIIWCIWNINPKWKTLTISLHELNSKFAHIWAFFFLILFPHSLHIYDLYQWTAFFFLAFPRHPKLVSWRYRPKFISPHVRVIRNVTNACGPPQSMSQKQKRHIFKIECVKIFLRKFYKQDPNLKRKLHAVLEFSSKESDKNTPSI